MLKHLSLTIILDFSELTNINILSGKCTLQSRMFLKRSCHSRRAVWNKKLCENKGAGQIRH